jgi:hypothetical protein
MMINVPYRKQTGLQDQPSQNQENVPPSYGQELAKKQRKVNRCNFLITRGKWTNEQLKEVMDAMDNGTISLRRAIGSGTYF